MGMPKVPFALSRQNPTAAGNRGGLGVAILAGTMRQLRASTVCDQSIRGPRPDAEYLTSSSFFRSSATTRRVVSMSLIAMSSERPFAHGACRRLASSSVRRPLSVSTTSDARR